MANDEVDRKRSSGLSLAPLTLREALKGLLHIEPDEDKQKGRRGRRRPQGEQEQMEKED